MRKRKIVVVFYVCIFLLQFSPINSNSTIAVSPLNKLTTEDRFMKSYDLSTLEYFDLMDNAFNFTSDELALLEQNGFIVLNRLGSDDIMDLYDYYWHADLPIFITSDTMLQLWHLIFDKLLEYAEEDLFYPLLKAFILEMKETFTNQITVHNDDIAVQHALIYLTVGAKLVDPHTEVPEIIYDATYKILDAIYGEITYSKAIEDLQTSQTKRFIDDFTMYRPRGHYTLTENLKKYFRLYKWMSRVPFMFDEYPGFIYFKSTPEEMIRSASYLVYAMKNSHVALPEIGIEANGLEVWKGFKNFLDPLIGLTYMITPEVLYNEISTVMSTDLWHPDDIADNDISTIKDNILNDETIPRPKDPFLIDVLNWPECLRIMNEQQVDVCSPKSLLLFGERLMPDTYSFNHLVNPYVVGKWFPNGLEFAATVLNSNRSRNLLINVFSDELWYDQWYEQLDNMTDQLNNWPTNEKQTLTWKWFEALTELTLPQPTFNDAFKTPVTPDFMKTNAWLDEKLTTVIGSWAQLKHDSILYAKQGLTWGSSSTPEGFVEPYPEFYKTLGELASLFQNSILQLNSLGFNAHLWKDPERGDEKNYLDVLDNYKIITQQLESIAYHELQGKELMQDEKDFIKNTYSAFGWSGWVNSGWLGEMLHLLDKNLDTYSTTPNTRASTVADIHTCVADPCRYSKREVLEVASGYLENLIAILPGWNGTDILAVGPVLSYYEFVLPLEYRMTDEDWRGILINRQNETLNQYFDFSMFARGFWAQNYMTSIDMTSSIVYQKDALSYARGTEEDLIPKWLADLSDLPEELKYLIRNAQNYPPYNPESKSIVPAISESTIVPAISALTILLFLFVLIVKRGLVKFKDD